MGTVTTEQMDWMDDQRARPANPVDVAATALWEVSWNADLVEGKGGYLHRWFADERSAVEWVRDNGSRGQLAVWGVTDGERTYRRGATYLGCNIKEIIGEVYRSVDDRLERAEKARAEAARLLAEAEALESQR